MIIKLCSKNILPTIIYEVIFLTFNLLSEIEFYFLICKNGISSCFSKVKSKVKFLLKLLKIAIPISQGGADKYFFKAFKN